MVHEQYIKMFFEFLKKNSQGFQCTHFNLLTPLRSDINENLLFLILFTHSLVPFHRFPTVMTKRENYRFSGSFGNSVIWNLVITSPNAVVIVALVIVRLTLLNVTSYLSLV